MEYRKLGRTGLDVSAIGLGTEHLERSRGTMEEVLRIAVDAGISYIDLLYIDPIGDDANFWDNIGPAIRHYRDNLALAIHWGTHNHDLDKSRQCFENVLSQIGNGYAEVAIIQVIDSKKQWDGWGRKSAEYLMHYKEQKQIGYIGMSGHSVSTAINAINSDLIDVLMFPINLIEHDDEEIIPLYQACIDNDVGLVAMKPYKGGTLFLTEGKQSGITPAQCLAYVLSMPISTTVPGAKNAEELRSTLHYLKATDEEKDYSSVDNIHNYMAGQCVYCHHCLPCPQDIDIGRIIWYVDQGQAGITDKLIEGYSKNFKVKAGECTECGVCIERCPFDVDVIGKMRKAVELFEAKPM